MSQAVFWAVTNQCATPGLGTLMARRRWSGWGQLALAVIGFGLIVNWMVRYFTDTIRLQMGLGPLFPDSRWLVLWGGYCFGAGWVWALFSSIALLRAAHRGQKPEPDTKPPVITVPPKLV